MPKTLITHINPHLDDIAAIWLVQKFFPEYKNAEIKFISAQKTFDVKDDENTLTVGVGRGKYDEHKGDLDESAMSLVWKDIKNQALAPKDIFETEALDEMVKWNTLIDTAKMPISEFDEFGVDAFIRSEKNTPADSLETVLLGKKILDRIQLVLIEKFKGLADWEKRVEFETRWGKSVALESDYFSKRMAYGNGFMVVIQKNSVGFSGITAPGTSAVDLTPVYLKLKSMEPAADWFLHHGKKMVLCGASAAPDAKKSRLTLEQLIEVVKTV